MHTCISCISCLVRAMQGTSKENSSERLPPAVVHCCFPCWRLPSHKVGTKCRKCTKYWPPGPQHATQLARNSCVLAEILLFSGARDLAKFYLIL
eukprot:12848798-Prorocentrum_lima.AAC.1